MDKEREAFSRWVLTHTDNLKITAYEENIMFDAWQAAKAQANKQFENFIDQAIEDSACADERRSLQTLLEDFQELTT
jgi:hypothetical protein